MDDGEPKRHAGLRVLSIFIVISLILVALIPFAESDPDWIEMSPHDRKFVWEFDNPLNYTLNNTIIDNGTLKLASTPFSKILTTQQDFMNGTITDLDASSIPGELTLLKIMPDGHLKIIYLNASDIADAYITNETPSFNYGGSEYLIVGNNDANNTYHGLFALNSSTLNVIPYDAYLLNSTISLYKISNDYLGTISANLSSTNWTEGEEEWNGTIGLILIEEKVGTRRTNEPVIMNISLTGLNISDAKRQLILFDMEGSEHPSRILKESYANGSIEFIELGFPITIEADNSTLLLLKMLNESSPLPVYRDVDQEPTFRGGNFVGDINCAPAIADLNLDGVLDIIVFHKDTQHIIAYNGSEISPVTMGTPLWIPSFDTGEDLSHALTATDTNLDGKVEIIYAAKSVGVKVIGSDGSLLFDGSNAGIDKDGKSQPAVADINLDGIPEIIFSDNDKKVDVISGINGSLVWRTDVGDEVKAVVVGDFNESFGLEIAAFQTNGEIAVIDRDGNVIWEVKSSNNLDGKSFAAACIDNDSFEDIICGEADAGTGTIYALSGNNGSEIWRFNTINSRFSDGLAVADINNDGENEIISGARGEKKVVAIASNGSLLWSFDLLNESRGAISFADFNGDGDLDIIFGDSQGAVQVLNSNGTELRAYQVAPPGPSAKIENSVLFGDIDGDAALEMITVSDIGIEIHEIPGFSMDWRIESRDSLLESSIMPLNSPDAVELLDSLWSPLAFPEAAVNWTHANSSTPWISPGGDFNPVSIDSFSEGTGSGWVGVNITEMVLSWIASNRSDLQSLFLIPTDSSQGIVTFASADNSNSTLHPFLTIGYNFTRYGTTGEYRSNLLTNSIRSHWTSMKINCSMEISTNLTIGIRAGNSNDPDDGSWSNWQNISVIDNLTIATIDFKSQYVQIRADFSTSNVSYTPILHSIEVEGVEYLSYGYVETEDAISPESITHWNRSWANCNLNNGTIILKYSTDGGGIWAPVPSPSGDIRDADESTGMIRFLIEFWSGDLNSNTPEVFNLSASYSIYDYPPHIDPIPDQNRTEDQGAWRIDLSPYLHDEEDPLSQLTWYIIGESLINVTGENITGNPYMDVDIPENVYGVDNITLILMDSMNLTASQNITINITPINDLPIIYPIPNQNRIEDQGAWTINLTAYLYDEEDPLSQLSWYVIGETIVTVQGENITGNMDMVIDVHANENGTDTITLVIMDSEGGVNNRDIIIFVSSENDPPYINPPIMNQLASEDCGPWTVDLSSNLHDVEDLQSLLSWQVIGETFVVISGEDDPGNMLMGISVPENIYGEDQVTLILRDTEGLTARQNFYINVTSENDPPQIEEIPGFTVHFDKPYYYDFTAYIEDVETPRSMLNLSSTGANSKYVYFEGHVATFELPESLIGEYIPITITVDDGDLDNSTTIIILVSDDNPPNLKESMPDIEMYQGDSLIGYINILDYFEDIDDDTLFFVAGNQYVDIDIDAATGLIDFFAPNNWYGTEEVTFRAVDPDNARAEDTIDVTVLKKAQPPSINTLPDIIVKWGVPFELNLFPYVIDPDTPLDELNFTTNRSTYIDFENGIMTVLFPDQDMIGNTYLVRLTVNDDDFEIYGDFNVRVGDNAPPTCAGLPDHEFIEDSPRDYPKTAPLDDFFLDEEDQNSLEFSAMIWTSNVTGTIVQIMGNNMIEFNQAENWFGETYMTVRSMDPNGGFAERTVELEIIPENDQPVIGSLGTLKIFAGRENVHNMTSNISDVETPIEMLLLRSDMPDYVTGISGHLFVYFPEEYLGDEDSIVRYVEIFVRDLDGGESSGILTIVIEREPDTTGQLVYLWWLLGIIAAMGAIMGLLIITRIRRGPFIIQDMMLIHNNGLLLARYARQETVKVDDDIFSGMLTAVLDFVDDAFSKDGKEITRFDFKEYTVAIQRGQSAYISIAFSGAIPTNFDVIMTELMEKIEKIYGHRIQKFSGNAATDLAGIEIIFNSFIQDNSKVKDVKKSGKNELSS